MVRLRCPAAHNCSNLQRDTYTYFSGYARLLLTSIGPKTVTLTAQRIVIARAQAQDSEVHNPLGVLIEWFWRFPWGITGPHNSGRTQRRIDGSSMCIINLRRGSNCSAAPSDGKNKSTVEHSSRLDMRYLPSDNMHHFPLLSPFRLRSVHVQRPDPFR